MDQPMPMDPQQSSPPPAFGGLADALQNAVSQNQQPGAQPTPAPVQPPAPAPQQQQQSNAPPRPRPILADLISGLIHPQAQALADGRPSSRVDVIENFLGQFMTALGSGMAAAHGPGANLKGFAAAVGAPYQQDVQRFQMGQQAQLNQADVAQRQAQTQLTQQQAAFLPAQQAAQVGAMTAQPRFDPATRQFVGNMTDKQFEQYVKGQGSAGVTATSKEAIAELGQLANQGKVAFVKPAQGGGYGAYDRQGNLIRVLQGAIDPAQLQRISTTQQWLPDGAGGFMAAPKTTISGPAVSPAQQLQQNVPALAAPSAQPPASGFPRPVRSQGGGASTSGQIYGKGSVFAYDPQTNERVLSTPAEVAAKGYTNPIPVKEGEIDKYRSAQVQFNDVQSNLSRYWKAARDVSQNGLSATDGPLIDTVINKSGLADMQLKISAGGEIQLPIISAFTEAVSRETRSAAYKGLSQGGKDLVDAYFRTMAAVPAYQKALTNVGKFNKEIIDLELANIPNPTMAPADQLRKLQAFQENVDQGSAGIPRMPGIPTLKETRARFEGQQASPNQLPASIQQLLTRPWTNR
jgi:hypothetical protein